MNRGKTKYGLFLYELMYKTFIVDPQTILAVIAFIPLVIPPLLDSESFEETDRSTQKDELSIVKVLSMKQQESEVNYERDFTHRNVH